MTSRCRQNWVSSAFAARAPVRHAQRPQPAVAALAVAGGRRNPGVRGVAQRVCEGGEFCLYFNSGNGGSLSDFTGSVGSDGTGSGCYPFLGSGKGQCVKNNAASVCYRAPSPVTVFYRSGYAGALQSFSSCATGNFTADLKNENGLSRIAIYNAGLDKTVI